MGSEAEFPFRFSSPPRTPTTYQEFKHFGAKIIRHQRAKNGTVSPTVERTLKGAKRMLMTGELTTQFAYENAALTQERERRKAMPNRAVQTGGVITIADAIRMKKSREDGEVEKEKKAEIRRQKKRDALIAKANERLVALGEEPPSDVDPALNPDYMDWNEVKRSTHYSEWYDGYQQQELEHAEGSRRLEDAGSDAGSRSQESVNEAHDEEDEIAGFLDVYY